MKMEPFCGCNNSPESLIIIPIPGNNHNLLDGVSSVQGLSSLCTIFLSLKKKQTNKPQCPVGKVLLLRMLFSRGRKQIASRKHQTLIYTQIQSQALTAWLKRLQSSAGDLCVNPSSELDSIRLD